MRVEKNNGLWKWAFHIVMFQSQDHAGHVQTCKFKPGFCFVLSFVHLQGIPQYSTPSLRNKEGLAAVYMNVSVLLVLQAQVYN